MTLDEATVINSFAKARAQAEIHTEKLADHERRILTLEIGGKTETPKYLIGVGNTKTIPCNTTTRKKKKKRWGYYTQKTIKEHEKRIRNIELEVKKIWETIKEIKRKK